MDYFYRTKFYYSGQQKQREKTNCDLGKTPFSALIVGMEMFFNHRIHGFLQIHLNGFIFISRGSSRLNRFLAE
ncbi:hypothetical protein AU378_12610 [Chryseobacterium kwangjuense]|uniref:Uncharacterized protein n=1 Tax=Chryseobacterium kwangjuense TaxID=267125 RepID=A0A135WED2_9FLAO|nr:hypothetical protein AU378_12610 [Chryseobacterium kwangjuense]